MSGIPHSGIKLRAEFRSALVGALEKYQTPFYAYDLATIKSKVEGLKLAFPQARLMYAMKANPRLGILRRMKDWGVQVEAVSLGEVVRAYRAGYKPDEVLLNGPVKTPRQLEELKAIGVPAIGIDSEADFRRTARILPGAKVLLRVNPDLPISTHDHLATGRGDSKFGVLPQDVPALVKKIKVSDLELLGLHIHLGSSLQLAEDFLAGYGVLQELFQQVGPQPVLNLGGGFGLGFDAGQVADRAQKLARLFQAELWLEPGRFLVAEAGVLVTRSWGTKQTRRNYLLVDAGMMTLMRPMMYGAVHPVEPLYQGGEPQTFDLAGPVCESGDVLAKDVQLPTPNEGDAVAILEAGAYGSSMSSNYLDYPRPLELLFADGRFEILRRPQSFESLFAEEEG